MGIYVFMSPCNAHGALEVALCCCIAVEDGRYASNSSVPVVERTFVALAEVKDEAEFTPIYTLAGDMQ